MQLIAPITDYIPASILTTLNDIVVRGAVLPARQPGLIRAFGTEIWNTARNAGGVQTLNVFAYAPSYVIFLANDGVHANQNWSVGIDDGDKAYCLARAINGTEVEVFLGESIHIERDAGNSLFGEISTIRDTGIDITWTLVGACNLALIMVGIP